jgi:hypothetical protein
MSTIAALLLVVGALVIGGAAHVIGEVTLGYEWAITGLAALVGGYLASEAFAGLSTWGPVFEGLYVLPAVIGAIIVGGIVDAIVRMANQDSYTHQARPI